MTVYRLRGKGNDGTRGGAAGDLIVTVLVQEHRIFHRDGLDLHMVLPISISTALLGGVVPVPLPHAACSVRVPPCARNGQRIRLAGKGVGLDGSRPAVVGDDGGGTGNSPHGSTRSGCGDLYVHLLVVIPKGEDLTGRQRCVIEKFVECAESNESDTSDEATPASLKERFRHWFES
ncbi:unnamed protein product [Trypanosoma congolense IL3000]|uniref:WGS project CAEQ00000000 data, annotated contig 695 n=1 Tax=Trypanosoma congolense (strain IL3000) TaxID=1068625 RepID=F9WHU1_TRYCI|nr:unnamed protein product [Trypanosoma congolense IL3000]